MKSSASISARNANRYQTLSRLLAGGADVPLPSLLAELAASFDLVETGLRWPVLGLPQVSATIGADKGCGVDAETGTRLAAARSSDEVLADPMGSRFLIPLVFTSRSNGMLWALPSGDASWQEEDRTALVLAAQCLAKHPAVLERIGAADQSRITQRMQDAALVSGKIAHDFDNIFTGVVGFAEMALPLVDPSLPVRQYLKEIMSAGNRGIQFTQQLHQLSRSGVARSLPALIGPILATEEARIRKNTTVRIQLAINNDLPAVALDATSLQVVFAHLLDNAVEASPPGGLLSVTSELIELAESEARDLLGNASAGPFVGICVSDEGSGVKEVHRKRLFVEPFFTTKVRHRGLGLPVVYRIVHAHRGGVRYQASGRGSIFQLFLPLAAARAAVSPTGTSEINRIQRGQAS
jgi:signal transduction histidine kinase